MNNVLGKEQKMKNLKVYQREKRGYLSIHKLSILALIIFGMGFMNLPSLFAQYDFNNGTVQGWSGPHINYTNRNWHGLSFVFDDYINYPNTYYDPVDNRGSISIQTLQTIYESPTNIEIEFRSPDLSNNPDWQNAIGWKGQLMFLGDLWPGDFFPGAYLELSTGHEVLIGEPLENYRGYGWHEITVYFPEDIPGFKWFSLRFNYLDGLEDMDGQEGIYGGIFLDDIQPIYEPEPLHAPVVSNIPNQNRSEGQSFATISLDNYVSDEDNSDAQMSWSYSGNSQLSVSINANCVATIGIPNANWNGSETITFTATDPGGLSDSDAAIFTVEAVNDVPIFVNLPDTVTFMNTEDKTLNMSDFVEDVDSPIESMTWEFSVNNDDLIYDYDNESYELLLYAPDFVGIVTLYLTVADDHSASTNGFFIVKVLADPSGIDDFDFSGIPDQYSLDQNYPNPFNPVTNIKFSLPKSGHVKIEIYNILGQHVASVLNEFKSVGYHIVQFDASHLPSGTYFYHIQTSYFKDVKRMTLLK